jgi:hypothetical protein
MFNDDVEQINYVQDKYYVLAVTQVASNSIYSGIWDSSAALSRVNAEEFRKYGVNAKSIHDILPAGDIAKLTAYEREKYSYKPKPKTDESTVGQPAVSETLREQLISKGEDYLIFVAWSGITMHIQTLGLPTLQRANVGYWIFDLKANRKIADTNIPFGEKKTLGDTTAKDYYEKDELQGLKKEAESMFRSRFSTGEKGKPMKASIVELIGLE